MRTRPVICGRKSSSRRPRRNLVGTLPLGMGVQVAGIIQQTDRFLTERLRSSISDLSQSEAQESTYLQLESILGELGDTDLSTSLSRFFAAVHNVQNQPEDTAVRNLAAMQGRILSEDIQRVASRVQDVQKSVNDQIAASAVEINRLLKEIAELNVRVVITEGGGTSASDAVGLRDQREVALSKLAEIVAIRSVEQQDGSVTVFAGGDYVVAQGNYRTVATSYSTDDSHTPGFDPTQGLGLTAVCRCGQAGGAIRCAGRDPGRLPRAAG